MHLPQLEPLYIEFFKQLQLDRDQIINSFHEQVLYSYILAINGI